MKKFINRHWYKVTDKARIDFGKILCYHHDREDCEVCPSCPESDICEACWEDIKKHDNMKRIECLKKLSEMYRNKEAMLTAIQQIQYHELVFDTIKIDNKVVAKRGCRYD